MVAFRYKEQLVISRPTLWFCNTPWSMIRLLEANKFVIFNPLVFNNNPDDFILSAVVSLDPCK